MAAGGGDVRWRFHGRGIVLVPRLGRAAAVVAKIGTEVPERPVGTARGQRGGTAGCLADKGEPAALATGVVAGEGTAGPRFCSAVCFYGWYQQRRCEVAQQLGVAVEAQLAAALAEVGRDDLDGVGI